MLPFLFSTGLWAFLLKYCISAGNYAFIDDIPEGAFDEVVQAVRQAKAMIAFNSMRRKAAKAGFLTDEEIEGIIADVRSGGREK